MIRVWYERREAIVCGMAYNFLRGDHDQPFLLPPDLRDWLPADHLAWFVLGSELPPHGQMTTRPGHGTGALGGPWRERAPPTWTDDRSPRPWHRRSWGAVGGASSPHMDR